jgi:DNA-binding GntR family transcriptional regulator
VVGTTARQHRDGATAGTGARIREDLLTGRLRPGQRLSESELSRQYGVSRSPVREALASLERDGLVERRGPAAFVRQRTEEEVLDIYAVRTLLEGMIAAHAAERRSADDVRRLDAALAFGRAVEASAPHDLMRANRAFHDALAHASHNQTLVDLQRRMTDQVAAMPATTLSAPGRWMSAIREHAQITEAVSAREVDRARTLAEQHMAVARDIRVRLFTDQAQQELRGPGSTR